MDKSFRLRLEDREHKEIKLFCVAHGISMQEFILAAIRDKKQKLAV